MEVDWALEAEAFLAPPGLRKMKVPFLSAPPICRTGGSKATEAEDSKVFLAVDSSLDSTSEDEEEADAPPAEAEAGEEDLPPLEPPLELKACLSTEVMGSTVEAGMAVAH